MRITDRSGHRSPVRERLHVRRQRRRWRAAICRSNACSQASHVFWDARSFSRMTGISLVALLPFGEYSKPVKCHVPEDTGC